MAPQSDPPSNSDQTPEMPGVEAPDAVATSSPETEEPVVEAAAPEAAPEAVRAAPDNGKPVDVDPAVMDAHEKETAVEGKVIGWNNGGFHVVVGDVTAFCPRSEMEIGQAKAPKSYLDKTYPFAVLKIEEGGRRVVLSRSALLKEARTRKRDEVRGKLEVGSVREGKIASLTDFGAFVDLGGVQGLVHISEISRQRVEKPEEVLEVGQTVRVKILKVEQGGKRISLSMKALEPDPWEGVRQRFTEGTVVRGTVEKVAPFGAFVNLEPGLTGLLPTATLSLPRGASLARMFPPGKEISVQILTVDPRRRRISLAPEGSKTEGTRADFESYRKQSVGGTGFNALAAALEKARRSDR